MRAVFLCRVDLKTNQRSTRKRVHDRSILQYLEMKLDGVSGTAVLRPNARVENPSDFHFGGFGQVHEVEISLHARVDVHALHPSHAHR